MCVKTVTIVEEYLYALPDIQEPQRSIYFRKRRRFLDLIRKSLPWTEAHITFPFHKQVTPGIGTSWLNLRDTSVNLQIQIWSGYLGFLIRGEEGHTIWPWGKEVSEARWFYAMLESKQGFIQDFSTGGGGGPASVPLCSHPRYTRWGGGLCQYWLYWTNGERGPSHHALRTKYIIEIIGRIQHVATGGGGLDVC